MKFTDCETSIKLVDGTATSRPAKVAQVKVKIMDRDVPTTSIILPNADKNFLEIDFITDSKLVLDSIHSNNVEC